MHFLIIKIKGILLDVIKKEQLNLKRKWTNKFYKRKNNVNAKTEGNSGVF